jgi:MYND finger
MTTVIKSLNDALDMQARSSAMFFDTAYTGHEQNGRGAIVTVFANIEALENHEQAVPFYVPRSELIAFDYAEVVKFVDMYDPEQYYVTLAVVTVSHKEKVDSEDNGILLCKVVHRHWCRTMTPTYDQQGVELCSRRAEDKEQEHANVLFSLKCARPDCKERTNLRVCSACNDARYCSKACQVANRAAHREQCKQLKESKRAAKEFIRQQSAM